MRQLLIFIIGFFCTGNVYADCAGNGLWVFPKGNTIKQNTIFIIEGYANSQEIILQLNKKHDIYLKSGQQKIKLLVTETYVGQFHLTQAILKPEKELEIGLEYTMHVDNLPEFEKFGKYNNITEKYDLIKYKTLPENDHEKPNLSSKPKEISKGLIHFGCGPSIEVVFTNPAKDKSEIVIKTTVKNLKTKKETTYYIQPDGKKIVVGHGMCSGAFNFENGNNFEVEFSFMDASGNSTVWTGQRIKFTKPTKETDNHED